MFLTRGSMIVKLVRVRVRVRVVLGLKLGLGFGFGQGHLAWAKCIICAALRWMEHEALLSPWVRLGLGYNHLVRVRVRGELGLERGTPWGKVFLERGTPLAICKRVGVRRRGQQGVGAGLGSI